MPARRHPASWLALAALVGATALGLYVGGPPRVSIGPRDTIAGEGAPGVESSDAPPRSATNGASTTAAHSNEAQEESRTAPLPVTGVVVEPGPLEIPVEGTGRAEAERRAEVAPRVGERIVAVPVAPGAVVRAGDVLVELDARPFQIGLREAEAMRERAAMQFDAELFADDAAPPERRENVAHRTGLTEAEQRVLRAELDLESAVLRAPFAGRVAEVSAHVGERAAAERPLVTVVALDRIRVPVEILEADFGLVDPGDPARVTFPALGDELFASTVRALGPELDPERGTGLAYVELANPDGRIRPGMFAQAEVAAEVLVDRIAVPRDAVLERDRRLLVFLAKNGRAEWSYVQTGIETPARIEIVSGVAPGDTVLVGGHLTLAHGAPVQVMLAHPEGARPSESTRP